MENVNVWEIVQSVKREELTLDEVRETLPADAFEELSDLFVASSVTPYGLPLWR